MSLTHFHLRAHRFSHLLETLVVAAAFFLPALTVLASGTTLQQQITPIPCTVDHHPDGHNVISGPECQEAIDRGVAAVPPTVTQPVPGRVPVALVPVQDRLTESLLPARPAAQAAGIPDQQLRSFPGWLVDLIVIVPAAAGFGWLLSFLRRHPLVILAWLLGVLRRLPFGFLLLHRRRHRHGH